MTEETTTEEPSERFASLLHALRVRNAQWALFVEHYLSNGFNARQAAISAGYSAKNAHNQGYRLTINDDIAAAIAAGKDAMKATPEEILMRMTRRGRGSIDHFTHQDADGNLVFDMNTDEAKQNIGNIKEIKFTKIVEEKPNKFGTHIKTVNRIDLKLADSMKADEILGKHHGIFKDKVEHSDDDERRKRSREERERDREMLERIKSKRGKKKP